MVRRGILLAGGTGTRLWPLTRSVSKQLLPVYSKPMIYYPLSTLMLAGIRDVMIITTPHEQVLFQGLLGDGSQWGMNLVYATQEKPEGIAQAFLIAEEWLASGPSCLVLGDNIFYGQNLQGALMEATHQMVGATVFAYHVSNPSDYGVVELNSELKAISLVEKPAQPRSSLAVTGLYFYDNQVVSLAKTITPSARGELEISAVNAAYMNLGALKVHCLSRGAAWLDTGTHESLLQAGAFVEAIEKRTGLLVSSPEEIAYRQGWIDRGALLKLAEPMMKTGYGQALERLANES